MVLGECGTWTWWCDEEEEQKKMPVNVVFMAYGCVFGFTTMEGSLMCGIDSEVVVNLMLCNAVALTCHC